MSATGLIRGHPLALSAMVSSAFVGWIALASHPCSGDIEVIHPTNAAGGPRLSPAERDQLRRGRQLTTVRPGMSRASVETVLTIPPDERGGNSLRVVAILPRSLPNNPGITGLCEVILEFAPEPPGQPLVRLVCRPL